MAQLRWQGKILPGQVKWIEEMSKLGPGKTKAILKVLHPFAGASRTTECFTLLFLRVPESEKDFTLRLNKLCNVHQQEAIINELDKASYYIERNANGKMLFHALSIKLSHIINNNSLILVN
jgi:DNA polymerase-3 subunit delta'